jgi:hypothetical protein
MNNWLKDTGKSFSNEECHAVTSWSHSWRHIPSVYRRFYRVAHRPRPFLSLTKVALIHRTGGSIWTEIFI